MASADEIIHQVWGEHVPPTGTIDLQLQWDRTVVRVIDHDRAQEGRWRASTFWKCCEATGIGISMDVTPCTLRRTVHPTTGREYFAEAEIRHLCTEDFWTSQGRENPSTLAVAVAHIRALHEASEVLAPMGGWVLILERDVVPTENAFFLFQATMRSLATGGEVNEGIRYVSLCVSMDRQDHMRLVLDAADLTAGRSSARHRLVPFPWKRNANGSFQLEHLGQGGRAYMVHTDLIRWLLGKRLWLWWDVFMNGEIPRFSMARFGSRANQNTARFCFPPAFSHPVNLTEVTRGSSRLEAHVVSAAERVSHYMTLALSKEWGLGNRLCTLAAVFTLCGMAGWGLHVHWVPNRACEAELTELVATPASFSALPGLAFLHVHRHWTHFQAMQSREQPLLVAATSFQATPVLFQAELLRVLRARQPPCPPELLRRVEQADYTAGWRCLQLHDTIQTYATAYLRFWPDTASHVAVHVRRGDLMRRDLHQASQRGSRITVAALQQLYDAADSEVEAMVNTQTSKRKCNRVYVNDRTEIGGVFVHVVTSISTAGLRCGCSGASQRGRAHLLGRSRLPRPLCFAMAG